MIEKESRPAQHASGRNSGVLHSGVYYQAKSLKAHLCVQGNQRLREYCGARGIAMNDHGKVIVAREARDLPMLDELENLRKPYVDQPLPLSGTRRECMAEILPTVLKSIAYVFIVE